MCAVRVIPVPEGRGQAAADPGILVNRVLPHPDVPTDHLRITLVRTEPGAQIPTHHHGAQDTTAYVLQGTMGLYCGAGLRQYVRTLTGEFAYIEPFVVHAEHNPEADEDNVAIVVRDSLPIRVSCEPPEDMPDGQTGITIISAPVASEDPEAGAGAGTLTAVAPHRLQTRRLTLERLTVAPGASFCPASATIGETALTVLDGAARVHDRGAARALEGGSGTWWYVEPGTEWSAESATEWPTELLLVHCAPPTGSDDGPSGADVPAGN